MCLFKTLHINLAHQNELPYTQSPFFPAKLTTPASVMVMPPATLMASFSSMRLNHNNRLSMTQSQYMYTGLSFTYNISVSFHRLLTHSGLQEWHINLLTSICVHPVFSEAANFLQFTIMSVVGNASFVISLGSKFMLMTSSSRCFP